MVVKLVLAEAEEQIAPVFGRNQNFFCLNRLGVFAALLPLAPIV
jgi:hypothetical protein